MKLSFVAFFCLLSTALAKFSGMLTCSEFNVVGTTTISWMGNSDCKSSSNSDYFMGVGCTRTTFNLTVAQWNSWDQNVTFGIELIEKASDKYQILSDSSCAFQNPLTPPFFEIYCTAPPNILGITTYRYNFFALPAN